MLQNTGKLFTPKRNIGSAKDEEELNTEKSPSSTISKPPNKSERIKLKASDIEYKFEADEVEDTDQNSVSDNCTPMDIFKSEYSDVGSKDEFDLNTIKNTFKKKLIRTPEVMYFFPVIFEFGINAKTLHNF